MPRQLLHDFLNIFQRKINVLSRFGRYSFEPSEASCLARVMMVARAHSTTSASELAQLAAQFRAVSSSRRVGALFPTPSCLGFGGHTGGSRQGHLRYTSAHTGGEAIGGPNSQTSPVTHRVRDRHTGQIHRERGSGAGD